MIAIDNSNGIACIRRTGVFWNISVLRNQDRKTIILPSQPTEEEAKNLVFHRFPNCCQWVSASDMIAELRLRRLE